MWNSLNIIIALMIAMFIMSLMFFIYLQKQLNKKLRKNHSVGYILDKNSEFYYYAYLIIFGVIVGIFLRDNISQNIVLINLNLNIIYFYILMLVPFFITFYLLNRLNYSHTISMMKYTKKFNCILIINLMQCVLFLSFLTSLHWAMILVLGFVGMQYFFVGRELKQINKKIKYIVLLNMILANMITASVMMHFTVTIFDNIRTNNIMPIYNVENLNTDNDLDSIFIENRYKSNNMMIIVYISLIEVAFLILNYVSMLIITYLDYLFGIFIQSFAILIGKENKILDIGILKNIDQNFIDFISVREHNLENWFILESVLYNKSEIIKVKKTDNILYMKFKEVDSVTIEFD